MNKKPVSVSSVKKGNAIHQEGGYPSGEMAVLSSSPVVEARAYPSGVIYNFYIYGPITHNINDYIELISTLEVVEKHDTVNLYINTPGGSLETTISIIHAISRSKAGSIIAHADGQVASAGTLLFFACRSWVVYPYAHAMFHDGSEIIGGKFSENFKAAQATSNLIRKICEDVYIPFFTIDEVDRILNGADMYLDSDELTERVVNGAEILKDCEEKQETQTEENS